MQQDFSSQFEASLKEAMKTLEVSIYAPMTGTVSMLLVELGERLPEQPDGRY